MFSCFPCNTITHRVCCWAPRRQARQLEVLVSGHSLASSAGEQARPRRVPPTGCRYGGIYCPTPVCRGGASDSAVSASGETRGRPWSQTRRGLCQPGDLGTVLDWLQLCPLPVNEARELDPLLGWDCGEVNVTWYTRVCLGAHTCPPSFPAQRVPGSARWGPRAQRERMRWDILLLVKPSPVPCSQPECVPALLQLPCWARPCNGCLLQLPLGPGHGECVFLQH